MSSFYPGSKLSASECYVSDVLYQNRHCNQEGFSVLICGGEDKNKKYSNKVFEVKVPSFEFRELASMVKPRSYLGLIVLNSDIMAIGGLVNVKEDIAKSIKPIEIYSDEIKTWRQQYIQMTERFNFCCCYFMKKMFVIGGWIESSDVCLRLCHTYCLKSKTWNQLGSLNIARDTAACAVFEGKIVVSGGWNYKQIIKSVEAYDYHENKWIYLPDMVEKKSDHASVSMGNKMFVIGGHKKSSCEQFDSFSRKFTLLRSFSNLSTIVSYCKAVCIGDYIIIFFGLDCNETKQYMYDVDKQRWSSVDFSFCKNLFGSACVKYYTE